MATNENLIPIPGRLHSVATEGHVAGANEIFDDTLNKDQATINSEVNAAIGTGGSVDTRISAAINALDSTKSQSAGADGLALNIVEEDGKITSISGSIASNTYDAYGAASAAKAEIKGNATSACDTLGEAEALISDEKTRAQAAEQLLQEQYNALTQSDIIVGTLPASGTKNKIYRVPGTSSYSDYMWNGSTWVLMATYNNATDSSPIWNSQNVITSDAVAKIQYGLGTITKRGTTFDAATYVKVFTNITFKAGIIYTFYAVADNPTKNWYVYINVNGTQTMILGGSSTILSKTYQPATDVTGDIEIRYGGVMDIDISITSGDCIKKRTEKDYNELISGYDYAKGDVVSSDRAFNIIIPNFQFRKGVTYYFNATSASAVAANLYIYVNNTTSPALAAITSGGTHGSGSYTASQDFTANITVYYAGVVGVHVDVKSSKYTLSEVCDIIGDEVLSSDVKGMIDSALYRFNQWNSGKEKIVLPLVSDLHANIYPKNKLVLWYACGYISELFGCNFIANLGDMGFDQDGSPATWNIDNVKAISQIFRKYQGEASAPVILIKGNHERHEGYFDMQGYSTISTSEYNNSICKDWFQGMMRKYKDVKFSKNALETYGYVDFEDANVRVIFLDTDDNITISTNINGMNQAQVDWLKARLLDTPENYNIVILQHRPISYYGIYKHDNADPVPTDTTYNCNELITSMLKGYIAKSIGSASQGGITASWDFTGVTGKIVGVFSGHCHFNWDKKEDGLNMIGTQGMGTSPSERVPSWGTYDNPSPINIDVVAVCPSERAIKLFKIGNGGSARDREFTF